MTGKRLSRRGFIGAAGAGVGLGMTYLAPPATAQQPAQQGVRPGGGPPTYPAAVRVRPNIASLTDAQLQSLRRGVQVMKSRPATDPTSWSFQANIHGMIGPTNNPLFKKCEHGTIQFLTWHRGYVYFFERILRAASGDPSLDLPYWDWTTAPALPAAFRSPADASNPLYDPTRSLNGGAQLPPSVVVDDLAAALAFVEFSTPLFTGFSPGLEGSPHGAVHVLIGGNMSSVPTAANDPIFWLHHGNIDRIWDRWLNQGAGRANPSDSAFLNQPYSYADESGQTVTVRVADILTSAQLGYRYDTVPNPPTTPATPAVAAVAAVAANGDGTPARAARLVASSAPRAQAAVEAVEAKPLSYRPETVKLNVVPQGAPALTAAADAASPARHGAVILEIGGLSFAEAPNFTYEVFLNLDEDAGPDRARLHRVGTINFFVGGHAHGEHGGHAAQPRTFDQKFDVTGLVARLREAGELDAEDLNVVLRPISPIAPRGEEDELRRGAEASAEKAKISYRKIDLLVNP